ncbi:pyridoxal phosphate-dependent aminotransferase [Cellulomonas bogoriensis]|uniref:Aminotransferase n=1 Tax=Cellulomonas bogoriensis 69B4 = DSM 16987 TaxID=1386082 RepID=A0A0A0BYS6_9CELL|nr:pyridoxal phosphate-dependent aminotransferase [Cellulomonas bogoriensis]KGM12837.1 aminotransferase [Cellulomonas bogoriensis 69B4 = DSM 16987]
MTSPQRRWWHVARDTGLLDPDGAVRRTVFAEVSDLAARTGAINLGQGFPDVDGPEHVVQVAVEAIRAGRNQYPPGDGVPELREAVAAHAADRYGMRVSPQDVLVTVGATEAIAATLLALVGPGEEVLAPEPYYDSYAAATALAGARLVPVPLVRREGGFRLDVDALAAATTDRTRVLLLNTPHNPTGAVLDEHELAAVARLARDRDLVVVTDEVYEHLTFDDARHVPIATLPGMAGRTVTISSAGKTLSFTGWKVGWVIGPPPLVDAIRTVKQFLTYSGGAPFQLAVAAALTDPDGRTAHFLTELRTSLRRRRELLCEGLTAVGFDAVRPQGTYFVVADAAPLGVADGAELCRAMPTTVGVAAVPVSAFCRDGGPGQQALASWVRFTFVKREDVLHDALGRLEGLHRG